jgi:hypothetical protein
MAAMLTIVSIAAIFYAALAITPMKSPWVFNGLPVNSPTILTTANPA